MCRIPQTFRRAIQGFTLIELMITVAIVAILASIAYPSYKNSVARGARADAKAALLLDAQFLESNFTTANRYDQDSAGNAITLPTTQVPKDGGGKYTISLPTLSSLAFTLKATRTGSMTGDACGDLTLDNTGAKGVTGGTLSVAACWNK